MEQELDYLTECFESKAPELLNHLYQKIQHLSQNVAELDEDTAKRLSVAISTMIVQDFGGEVIYIPKSLLMPLSGRDLKIFHEFDGKNYNELANKYNVSVAWVYRIVKRVRREEIAKRQMDMFG